MIIAKYFTFEAAHKLPNEDCYGACRNLHGHSYKLIIEIKGDINENGWIINFKDLKKIVNEKVINILDHSYINDYVELPTAENIILWITNQLEGVLNIYSITLYETENSYAKLIY